MFAVNGILFNHESPRRGGTFVTKKVVAGAVAILAERQDRIVLGNLSALRDWGHARDYIRAMWLMLQADIPDDFVIATGSQISVREFVSRVFSTVGLPITWRGEGPSEQGVTEDGRVVVVVDEKYFRPTEVDSLLGESGKARRVLGWSPEIDIDGLIDDMIKYELMEQKITMQ